MGTSRRELGLLVAVLCLGVASAVWAAPSAVQLAPPSISVANSAGEAGDAVVPVVQSALAARAGEIPKLRAPSPWELSAEIQLAEQGPAGSRVTLAAELRPPEGSLVYLAQATGEGEEMAEAAGAAVGLAMEELGVCLKAKGTVYYCDDVEPKAVATIGSEQGLLPGARVAFVRRGKVVAEGRAECVRSLDADLVPAAGTPAGTIMKGDDVFVVENGSRAAFERQQKSEEREKTLTNWIVFLSLGGLIAIAR